MTFRAAARDAGTAVLVALLLPTVVAAQEPAVPQVARVLDAHPALVLSGGSARGIAHAGVLLALEELGYDPPFVAGTSMGAIIGALYAAGYTAAEIVQISDGEPWLERFFPRPLPVGADRRPLRPLLDIGIGGARHDGLMPATGVNLRLVELLFDAGARARNDFDRLPRRFRAVAADLRDGSEVVLSRGDLPRAVRASMAVPGAFPAVRLDGRVLVDGGIINNLPVSVARAETDLPVIAVDVVRPAAELAEQSPLDIGVRALRLLMANAYLAGGAAADVLIVPALPHGAAESRFPMDGSTLVNRGREAALASLPRIGPPIPPGRPAAPPVRVDHLVIAGADTAVRRLARQLLLPALGEYDADRIVGRTRALYATGLFNAAWPRLDFAEGDDAPATLVVELVPAPRSSIAAAARWDNDVGAGAWATIRHRLTLHEPVELDGGMLVDDVRRRAHLDASVFSGILPGVVWSFGVAGGEDRIRTFDGEAGRHRIRRAGGWAGAELHGPWAVSLLARGDWIQDLERDVAGWATGPFLRIARPPLRERIVGVGPSLEAELRFGDGGYGRVSGRAGIDGAAGPLHVALLADVAAASADAPLDALFATTRELVPWLPEGSLRAPGRAVAGIDIARPTFIDGFARLRLRAVATTDRVAGLRDSGAWQLGGEAGAAWPTVVGTLEVGVAAGTGARRRLNIGVGAAF
jgi:predicted acylesterase/phospholipase RssA